jgi:hypothetical protein
VTLPPNACQSCTCLKILNFAKGVLAGCPFFDAVFQELGCKYVFAAFLPYLPQLSRPCSLPSISVSALVPVIQKY